MKLDWKKQEKMYYLPKSEPELLDIPGFGYFIVKGEGNPNDDFFADYIKVLYSLSYAVKMSPKSGFVPNNYSEYTVFPLEGIWDLKDDTKNSDNHLFDKNDLAFNLMIRQPDFVTSDFAEEIIRITSKKKPDKLLEKVVFGTITDGLCIQMLHTGPYDTEPESFRRMEEFAKSKGLIRPVLYHREIYLSDARKTAPEKLRTVLRFKVKQS
jgi:hypothetical protein